MTEKTDKAHTHGPMAENMQDTGRTTNGTDKVHTLGITAMAKPAANGKTTYSSMATTPILSMTMAMYTPAP